MRKIITSFILCIVCLTISAQTTFFKWYPSDKYEYTVNAIELANGNFILTGSQAENRYSIGNSYLLKIDSLGQFVDENIITNNDTNSCYTIVFNLPNDSNIITLINHKSYSTTNGVAESNTFEKYDTESSNIIFRKEYLTESNKSIIPQKYLIKDTSIYLLSHYADNNQNFLPLGTVISKFNRDFDSIDSFIDLRPSIFEAGILDDIENNSIKCISGWNQLHICNLDYNLNLINTKEVFSVFSSAGCATPFSNSKYLLTGTANDLINIKRQIKVITNNMNDEKIDSISYYNNADSILYAGFVTNTAIVGADVFIVGNYLFDPIQWPFQNNPTFIQITRLDTNLNIIDHHFYGGDAVYTPYKIISTLDGGALITGIRYDHNYPDVQLYHPFVLKVNNEGMVTTDIDDEYNPISHSAIVFPNPGKDILNLTSGIQLNHGMFTLYDMQGRPVITKEINATEMQFDASAVSSGSYVWKIVLNNKVMDSGKWIKE